MRFTFDAYMSLLEDIRDRGYKYIFYDEIGTHDKEVLIRHDVDFSLEKALEMAKIESQLNVRSSYFVLITSPFYNIHEKKSRQIIKEILELGHKIGLHFDYTIYNTVIISEIIDHAKKELELLSVSIESNVNTISFHRPAKFILDSNVFFSKSIINTYSKEFFKDIKYISDSRMSWKANPFDILCEDNKKIQILVHPIWYNIEEKSITEIFKVFFNLKSRALYNDMNSNFTDLHEYLKPFDVLREGKK